MTDLIGLGLAGLRTYQTALDVTGENINNANTVGYTRRTAVIQDSAPAGAGYPLSRQLSFGAGAEVIGIRRSYNSFLAADARVAAGDYARANTRQTWLTGIQAYLNNDSQALGNQLTKFYNAAQDVASDPTSISARDAFLSAAGTVADKFRALAGNFTSTKTDIKDQATQTVSRINQIAGSLEKLNNQIRRSGLETSQSAGLQDERDKLLTELAQLTKIDVRNRTDGGIEVRLDNANGAVLLDSSGAKLLGVAEANGKLNLTLDPFGQGGLIPMPSSGSLAGLNDAYVQASDSAAQVDKLAQQFVTTVNAQHRQGADLNGAAGGDLFTLTTIVANASRTNIGSATVRLDVTDQSLVQAQGYELRYDGGTSQWTLKRNDGSASISGTGALDLDGMHIDMGGAPKDGDFYQVTGNTGALGVQVMVKDAAKVAAAAPFSASAAALNKGTASVSVRVNSAAAAITPALPAYRVDILANNGYNIVNPSDGSVLATGTVTPGGWVAVNGFEYSLTGATSENDSFTLQSTPANQADNGNMLQLIDTRLGNPGFEGLYTREVTRVATNLSDTTALATAAKGVSDKAAEAASAANSVNLDEEAADLIRFQQAYQAAARIISTARELFQTVLNLN